MVLPNFFTEHPEVAIAFSGGADSSYLLAVAAKYAVRVKAYLAHSAFQPLFEIQEAKNFAAELDIPLEIITMPLLEREEVTSNPSNRCYFCKQNIFTTLWKHALKDGFPVLCDGTNATDDYDNRPGMRALRELKVLSPLRECGLSKKEIRNQSKKMGLVSHNKPSYSCLATRVPVGTEITQEILNAIEGAEMALFALGFQNFRVRYGGTVAQVEVLEQDMVPFIEQASVIREKLNPYFEEVTLNLKPRELEGE